MGFSWEMSHHWHNGPLESLASLTAFCVWRFLEARWDTLEEPEVLGLFEMQIL